ncbi:MAG: hypothetical protein HYY45_08920 [Deltaproteobacteria bacterium]|nr:hypothetical protein [Deltaproteobacteria bacterium]
MCNREQAASLRVTLFYIPSIDEFLSLTDLIQQLGCVQAVELLPGSHQDIPDQRLAMGNLEKRED